MRMTKQGEGEDFVPMKITYYAFAALPRIGDTLDVPSGDGLSFSRHRVMLSTTFRQTGTTVSRMRYFM